MNGITILEQPCPRCANRRTVRIGTSTHLVCFNCRGQWTNDYTFTQAEVKRLTDYREAVRVGFFNDWNV
jgi:hypothetical protein